MTTTDSRPVDEKQAEAFSTQVMMYNLSATIAATIHLGVRLGLYAAMRGRGPLTAAELAEATGTHERFVLEWLRAQAAADIIGYAGDDRFGLSDVQAAVLADEDSFQYRAGAFRNLATRMNRIEGVADSFRTGLGLPGMPAEPDTADSVFAVFHRSMLVPVLLPALDGAVEKLRSGGSLADVGCGNGIALLEIAKAFPDAELHGFDLWTEAIEQGRAWATEAGVTNVTFHEARAEDLPDDGRFDLVCAFDCVHDMTRPAAALAAMRRALKPDGTLVIGDIKGGSSFEANLEENPIAAAAMYSISVLSCLQSAMSEPDGAGLGTLGFDEQTARRMTAEAGFSRFRALDIDHLFNAFYEIRP